MFDYIEDFEHYAFGLLVHFGLYSKIGKGEWYQNFYKMNDNDYRSLLANFYVSKNWAKNLVKTAKKAGCRYITITTRHHDGFSLYNCQGLSDFDAPHSACGRDLIGEFVDECRREAIVPFFYHTLLDWHQSDYQNNFSRYLEYLYKSVEILCTSYGKIGGFWFDGMWDKPNVNWRENELYALIRKKQPKAMIINNTGLSACGKVSHPEIDSVTFERGKPCFVDQSDRHRAGEMSQILNDHWGYAKQDCNYKSVSELIDNLIECRSYNCNFLLNTGLKGNGKVNGTDECLLSELGKWIKTNKNFIYDAKISNIAAENAIMFKGNDCYYAVIKNVGMSADLNVALKTDSKKIKIDANIKDAVWLDNNEKIDIKDNVFYAKPFSYGASMFARVAKIKL